MEKLQAFVSDAYLASIERTFVRKSWLLHEHDMITARRAQVGVFSIVFVSPSSRTPDAFFSLACGFCS
jgi:hypothetical protein